jgi:hypothetical protein
MTQIHQVEKSEVNNTFKCVLCGAQSTDGLSLIGQPCAVKQEEKAEPRQAYKFTVVTPNEDPTQAVILKEGLTAKFTLAETGMDTLLLEKKREEIDAEVRIQQATMTNIERTNPDVAKMSEADRQITYVYQKAFAVVKVGKEKLAELDNAIAEIEADRADILKQTGLQIPSAPVEPAPEQPKANG